MNIMNKFMKRVTAACTVALLLTSPVAYSGNNHQAVVDAYDKTYGDAAGMGMIISSAGDDTTIRLIGVKDDPVRICDAFGDLSAHIIVIDKDFNEKHYDCSL